MSRQDCPQKPPIRLIIKQALTFPDRPISDAGRHWCTMRFAVKQRMQNVQTDWARRQTRHRSLCARPHGQRTGARALHEHSAVLPSLSSLSIVAIPESLLESECSGTSRLLSLAPAAGASGV